MERRQNLRWYDKLSVVYTLMAIIGSLVALVGFLTGLNFRQIATDQRVEALEKSVVTKELLNARLDGIAKAVQQLHTDLGTYNQRVDEVIRWTNEKRR